MTENIKMQKGNIRTSKMDIKQLVEGDMVVLLHKKLAYYPHEIVSEYLNVKILKKTPRKFIGKVIKNSPSGILMGAEIISFSTKNIVKTPYEGIYKKNSN